MARPKGSRDTKPRKARSPVCKYSDDCEKCPLDDCHMPSSIIPNRHQFLSEVEMFGSMLTTGNENPKPRGKGARK